MIDRICINRSCARRNSNLINLSFGEGGIEEEESGRKRKE
jgi:hypothetical protein